MRCSPRYMSRTLPFCPVYWIMEIDLDDVIKNVAYLQCEVIYRMAYARRVKMGNANNWKIVWGTEELSNAFNRNKSTNKNENIFNFNRLKMVKTIIFFNIMKKIITMYMKELSRIMLYYIIKQYKRLFIKLSLTNIISCRIKNFEEID